MKMNLLTTIVIVLVTFTSIAVSAQQTSSAIIGKVEDAKGGALPGTTVQIVHIPTNATLGVTTNDEGRYFVANLNPGGPYQITATFVGYKTAQFNDVYLKLGETLKLNVTLQEDAQVLAELNVVGV